MFDRVIFNTRMTICDEDVWAVTVKSEDLVIDLGGLSFTSSEVIDLDFDGPEEGYFVPMHAVKIIVRTES